jgi:predicted nucleic acid-binding protein
MPDKEILYWDSCVFLSLVNADADRLPEIQALLTNAERGQLSIITSALTITEVAYGALETSGDLDDSVLERIDALWAPESPVQLVETFPTIAVAARDLVRATLRKRPKLRPYDALHVATAQHNGATQFHTYDDKLLKLKLDVGMPITNPVVGQPTLGFTG